MKHSSLGYEVQVINDNNVNDNCVIANVSVIARCTKGWATLSKNGEKYRFSKGHHFITAENVCIQFFEHSDDFECTICAIAIDLISEICPFLNTRVWNAIELSTPDNCKEKRGEMLNTSFDQIVHFSETDDLQYNRQIAIYLIVGYIYLIYNRLIHFIDPNSQTNSAIGGGLLDNFYQLCSKYHTQQRNADFYANKLHVSSRHLFNVAMKAHGESPKTIINNFVIGTIKKLLLTTSLSIQQIATSLNFPDQSTLRQYFKRSTGINPSEYRKSHLK